MRIGYNIITLLLVSCLLLSSSAIWGQKKPKRKKSKDPIVKVETRWDYKIVDQTPAEQGNKSTEIHYNEEGKKDKWLAYTLNGQLKYQYGYTHSEGEIKRFWKTADGQLITDYTEEHDEFGNVTKLIRYKPTGDQLDIIMYEYDMQGRKSDELYYDDQNQKVYEIIYRYNDFQHTMTETHVDHLNNEEYLSAIELNEANLPVTLTRYNKSGPLVNKTTFKRDEQGRLIEKMTYKNGKTLDIKETYEYSESGDKKTCSIYVSGGKELVEYVVYTYEYYK
ncbi:MAG: hypothetical protein GY810_29265 [Aureispira sp.]|nr:hypothetical protein [Aureispira sp.]